MNPVRQGIVIAGHGVASGASGDPRFPDGTLALQLPIFAALGADVATFHAGTINVRAESVPRFNSADHVFREVKWHIAVPAEDFSLYEIELEHRMTVVPAMIYRPHPETKPDHHQPADVIEMLAPYIPTLRYGDAVSWRRGRPEPVPNPGWVLP